MADELKKSQSLFRKLSSIFKTGPVVRRKVRGIDTTIASADRTKSSGAMLFQRSNSPSYSVMGANAYNLSERMMRYNDFQSMEMCLAGDTLIAVPNGYKKIEDLANECSENPDFQFVVYAYDHQKKKIVPAYGKQARQTCIEDAWKVTFSHEKSITGTANHRLMLVDGTYSKIEDLKPGQFMMPFIRHFDEQGLISEFLSKKHPTAETTAFARRDVTFGRILEVCERVQFDQKKLQDALDVRSSLVLDRLNEQGFDTFELFAKTYSNKFIIKQKKVMSPGGLEVVSVEHVGKMPLFDLTVDGYKNFATDTVMSHNTPEIASTLDIYSDETVSVDEKGQALHIYSSNEKIKEILEDLFYNTVNTEFNLRHWTRNLVKYGDLFCLIDVHPQQGVIGIHPIPVNEIEREENFDQNDPFAVRYRWVTLGNRILENWEVAHFRLLGNDMFLPYGSSVIESARRIWRQLILIEDAMLTYRVVRAPERRVFYVDVGNIPPAEVEAYMQKQKQVLKNSPTVDRQTGQVDLRYNPLSIEEDFYIPVRGQDTGTKIETLAGGQNVSAVEDVSYLQKKLIAALKIPRAYLGYDEGLSCLSGDTKIPLVDGRCFTIEQLANMDDNSLFGCKIYSLDYKNGKSSLVQRNVKKAWKTKEVSKIYHVELDNGYIVKCTENHPFLLRSGEYVRADQLKPGESLAASYQRVSQKQDKVVGYPMHSTTGENWKFEHRTFASQKYNDIQGWVVHHVDFNKFNNKTENLLLMKNKAHQLFHATLNRIHKIYAGSGNPRWNKTTFKELVFSATNNNCTTKIELLKATKIKSRVFERLLKDNNLSYQEFATLYMPGATQIYKCHGHDWSKLPTCDEIVSVSRQLDDCSRERLREHFKVNSGVLDLVVQANGHKNWGCFKRSTLWGLTKETIASSVGEFQSINTAWENKFKDTCSFTAFIHEITNIWGGRLQLLHELGIQPYKNHAVSSITVHELSSTIPVYDLEVEAWSDDKSEFDQHNFGILAENYSLSKEQQQSSMIFVHNSKASLAQLDIRFSRSINIIQKTMIAELNKIAIIHLFAHGYENEDLQNFTLRLSNPSTVAQQQKLELWRAKFEIAGSSPEGMTSKDFIRKEIMGLNDEECKLIDKQRLKEKVVDASIEGAGGPEEGGGEGGPPEGGGGGGNDLFGGDEEPAKGSEPTGDTENPPPEKASDTPAEEEDSSVELLTSSDNIGDDEDFALRLKNVSDPKVPVKAKNQLSRALYNNSRERNHGASKTQFPDYERMTNATNREMSDPYDLDHLNSVVTNPLGESSVSHVPLSQDMIKMLSGLDVRLGLGRSLKKLVVLHENIDIEIEEDAAEE